MPSIRTRDGLLVMLVALLLLTSSFAVLYYDKYQQQVSETNRYVDELGTALGLVDTLSSSYGSALGGFNKTISLLTDALSNLNTSTPAYALGSRELRAVWDQYVALARAEGMNRVSYAASLLLDFGNGTTESFVDRQVQPGWNAYVTTLVILNGSVQAAWYPEFQEHYVTALDGVAGGRSTAWFFWTLNESTWVVAPAGADSVQVHNGTALAWTLCAYDQNFLPTCTPQVGALG